MERPYVICHMLTSLDGKVTGNFLSTEESKKPCGEYYRINREFKADAFACGRVTMEGSFTGGWYPDLTPFKNVEIEYEDFVANGGAKFFAVAFDRFGKLGWKQNKIVDEDPGYAGAHIIEVLSTSAPKSYLAYLKSVGISYIFAGESQISIAVALNKLKELFGIKTLLLEGGSEINGAFAAENLVDELSLVQVPIVAEKHDKPLFYGSNIKGFKLISTRYLKGDAVWLRYENKLKSNGAKKPKNSKRNKALIAVLIVLLACYFVFPALAIILALIGDARQERVDEYFEGIERNKNVVYYDGYDIYFYDKTVDFTSSGNGELKLLYVTANEIYFYYKHEDFSTVKIYNADIEFNNISVIHTFDVVENDELLKVALPPDEELEYFVKMYGAGTITYFDKEKYYSYSVSQNVATEIDEDAATNAQTSEYYSCEELEEDDGFKIKDLKTGEEKLILKDDMTEVLKVKEAKFLHEESKLSLHNVVINEDKIYLQYYASRITITLEYSFATQTCSFVDWAKVYLSNNSNTYFLG